MMKFLNLMGRVALVIAVLALILLPLLVPSQALATPFRQTISMNAGSGSYTITNVYSAASTGVRLQALHYSSLAVTTSTVSYIASGTTNSYGSKVVSATDRVLVFTNIPALFIGDRLPVTSSDTNAHSIYVVGEEF